MRTYAHREIESLRMHYDAAGYPLEHFEHDGTEYDYFVLPREECPQDMPDMALCMAEHPAPADNGPARIILLAISQMVPEDFRLFVLVHELEKLHATAPEDRCIRSAERELEIVREKLAAEKQTVYIRWRVEHVGRLIGFMLDRPQRFPREALDEYRKVIRVFELALAV